MAPSQAPCVIKITEKITRKKRNFAASFLTEILPRYDCHQGIFFASHEIFCDLGIGSTKLHITSKQKMRTTRHTIS